MRVGILGAGCKVLYGTCFSSTWCERYSHRPPKREAPQAGGRGERRKDPPRLHVCWRFNARDCQDHDGWRALICPLSERHLGHPAESLSVSVPATYVVHRDSQRHSDEVFTYIKIVHALVNEAAAEKRERAYFGRDLD